MALVGCAKQLMSEGISGPIGLYPDVVSGWCGVTMHEQSTNHISLQKVGPRCYVKSPTTLCTLAGEIYHQVVWLTTSMVS